MTNGIFSVERSFATLFLVLVAVKEFGLRTDLPDHPWWFADRCFEPVGKQDPFEAANGLLLGVDPGRGRASGRIGRAFAGNDQGIQFIA